MLAVTTFSGWRSSVKLRLAAMVGAVLFWSSMCWGQPNEIDRLNRVVEQQGKEIEELKSQLSRIERALATGPAATLQPASYSLPAAPPIQAVQAPQAPQAPAAAPAPAGFRFTGDLRFRLDAAVRGATP